MYCAQLGCRTGGAQAGMEKAVSDVKIEQKQVLSRQEAARFIAALTEGLGDDGRVTVRLGGSTLELSVASQVNCELEVAVDGDEIELELELKWSISGRPSVEAAEDQSGGDDREEDESGEEEPEEDQSEVGEAQEDSSEETPSDEEAAAGAQNEGGAPGEVAAGSSEAESVAVAAPEESGPPRRGRRKPAAATGRPSLNGVDNAAVRAWAAANGVTVSPRGRIKDEVIEAYRAAGN
jgi:amphi-Trp domain-containing protein